MEDICPLCERNSEMTDWETELPADPLEIQNEIANLDRTLEGLESQDSLLILIENRHLMCVMCRQLLENIEDESDRQKLEERINKLIEKLQEHLEDEIPS